MNRARRFRRAATLLSRGKRLATYSIIGYSVFDGTVGVVILPLFIGLLPLTSAQSWCIRRWQQASSRATFYVSGLRRLDNQWQGRGEAGQRYHDPSHAYSSDLDLFGRGSLFELLCTAKTRAGQDTLASWLLNSADRRTIIERQRAIDELRNRVELRETVATLHDVGQRISVKALKTSSADECVFSTRRGQVWSTLWIVVVLASLVGAGVSGGRWWVILAVTLFVEAALYHMVRPRLRSLCQSISNFKHCLSVAAPLANLIRRIDLSTPLLSRLCKQASNGSRVDRLVRRTLYAIVLNEPVVLMVLLQLFPPLERLHRRVIEKTRTAVEAMGQFEVLCVLATYAFERPQDVFAEIADAGPEFRAEGLGHPLLVSESCVRNDVCFDPPQRLVLISGSNMSGKTTLMRSVGVNVVLAFAGAPVRATRMTLSPFTLGTAIRFADSLQEGTSHFAAVVQRMKQVIEMQDDTRPLLYLFDEILQGTNSQDRRVGAATVLRKLIDAEALGIVSTHDLALTEMVSDLGGRAVNMHFEDRVVDGQMIFDYQLRPGVVQKSNALDVMRSFGLDV